MIDPYAPPAAAPLIYAAMVKAMASIGHIGKSRKNTQQNYSFRGIDDLYNAVHPALVEAQIFICPSVTNRDHAERESKQGGVLFYETLTVDHRFYAVDGSFVTVTTMGSAMDSGDKAVNKAMSAAMKYALLEAFAIPTEGDNDTESHSPAVVPQRGPSRQEERQRPTPAPAVALTGATKATGTMAAKPSTPSPMAVTTASTTSAATPGKADCDQLYFRLIGDGGALHKDYLPLVKQLFTSSPTMDDRHANLSALLKSVTDIHAAMGKAKGVDMISDITLSMPIDRNQPTPEDAGTWLEALVHTSETGEKAVHQ